MRLFICKEGVPVHRQDVQGKSDSALVKSPSSMPMQRRALGDLSDVPVTPIQEADIEQDSATPSSSLSKPLLDHEAGLGLHDELPARNGPREGREASQEEKNRFITTILINLSAIMERTDEQLLPAVYRFVGASFQVCCLQERTLHHLDLIDWLFPDPIFASLPSMRSELTIPPTSGTHLCRHLRVSWAC